ncbi:MAG TPA: GNAT family N-acetyltransferase [Polyangiaceae bacterium LLY-WYZ-15_(1-7)]|nr:GNAT family N-acetyltransferase [Polyangiaceae bacterium LLY-WYZ-15_(1-7)]HJL11246.1 GNAT family N-acetyltransferase [Polyangiaceae bacterium LLY-WYZ-15_(1-7)]HJL25713.1 GNAT family N-acetyltransferase [Polyangiaceae bacterium LLY-WYZ-15_(1-7)]HJL30236.1 GNAT family N-acetyltransferase [Polyangiaceae bacterium LLY-WYZ-15_(1-7)]HJL38128.1 GNAT family N-acetyltransferase [Polyangiaceae bacterium LLY-WYZ-15_(1-7)]
MGERRIRRVGPEAAAEVHAAMRAGFVDSARYAHPSSALRESVEDVRAALGRGGGVLLEIDGALRGSGRFAFVGEEAEVLAARLREAGDEGAPAPRVEADVAISRLAVEPEARGQGHGAAMVEWIEALARRLGARALLADARSQQPDNRGWWRARGFEVIGYAPRYGIPDIRTHMRKTL